MSTIGNIFQFIKCMIHFDINSPCTYPLIRLRLSHFTEFIYESDFKALATSHLQKNTMAPTLPHLPPPTVLPSLHPCRKQAGQSSHHHCRDPLPPTTFRDAELLFPRIVDILRACVIGDNMGTLSHQPSTYSIFPPPPPQRGRSRRKKIPS